MRPVLCSCGRENPSAPSGIVPLRGGAVLPSAWRTKRPLWPRMANKTAIMAAHGKQKGRYDPKIRMSWKACEKGQIVPFLLISVTRLLRNPAQIADLWAILLHKTGLPCNILSEQFTFWTVWREISESERKIPSPGISFSGLGIFISGLGWKNPGTEIFSRRLRGRFSFSVWW